MLVNLSIRDVVLIDRLDLSFHGGLCVLTGETGAGKSILLDALGSAAQCQAQGVEENRLTGAGLACQDAKPAMEGEIQLVDENDIPDRKVDEHERLVWGVSVGHAVSGQTAARSAPGY